MRSSRELSIEPYAGEWPGLRPFIFPPTADIGADTRPSIAIMPPPRTAWIEFFTFVVI